MALYCPACKNEILPYLKTGEFKQVVGLQSLVSYQFYYCVHCKTVYYEEHECVRFLPLKQKEEPIAKDPGKVSNTVSGKNRK